METILLFGASKYGQEAYHEISQDYHIAAFIDNDPSKHGTRILDTPVIAPQDIPNTPHSLIVITSSYAKEIGEQLLELGFDKKKIKIYLLKIHKYENLNKPLFNFYIDVFGYCNLRCPSCPVGNWTEDEAAYTKGIMKLEYFSQLLDKAQGDCRVGSLGLYNWTEPMLNPHLPELVQEARSRNIWTGISSNMNLLKKPHEILEADLTWFRASVSGFNQETYSKGHVRGDIEKVKQHMTELAKAKKETGAKTQLECFFHKYVDNEQDQAEMKIFAEDLGYEFKTGWAYLMPVEKLLSVVDPSIGLAKISQQDKDLETRLALKSKEAVEASAGCKQKKCDLLEDFIVLDVKGDVFLCCAASGAVTNKIGNYLEMDIDQIQTLKKRHKLCGPCIKKNIFSFYNDRFPDTYNDIGNKHRATYAEAHNS